MKEYILITYKTGSSITIEIPENFYADRYAKKSSKKLHEIFIKDYRKFVKALNRSESVVDVSKYLPFSNASVCGKDIVSVDIKSSADLNKDPEDAVKTYVPGVHDQVYLNITGTDLEKLLNQLAETGFIEKCSNLIDKLYSYVSKSNVEFTIKTAKKTPATTRKKKVAEAPVEQTSEPASQVE